MKKGDRQDDLRPEYTRDSLGQGVRGKYYEAYQQGTNLVLLSPDVAQVFQTEKSVNDALRSLIDLAKKTTDPEGENARKAKKQRAM